MLPGYSGHLVSEHFLERTIDGHDAGAMPGRFPAANVRLCRISYEKIGPASSLRAVLELGAEPLLRALGFDRVTRIGTTPDILFATAVSGTATIGVLVTTWGERLDRFWRPAVVETRARGASWCVLFNGTHLRLLQPGRVFSRRYAEFDLGLALDDERSLTALWTLASAAALGSTAVSGVTPADILVRESERHAAAVCHSLRDGVLAASQHVLGALVARRRSVEPLDAFDQALTIVYRMLFLLFAEARALVPLWHPVYRESYSLEELRDSAMRRAMPGLWDTLRAVNELAHSGCLAGDLRVTPFNGRLFAPSRTPLIERGDLDDEAARQSLMALSTRPAPDREGRELISYRDLGVEQLGAVYETLLDYVPRVKQPESSTSRRTAPIVVTLQAGSGVRKATGTFYTPQPLARYLVRQALEPLVHDASPEQILSLKVLDPSMGSGAFLVAACDYLADAYEIAVVRSSGCHPGDVNADDRIRFRRKVAERCLYGVDVNPMAVQLARLSLWLATLAADRPLSFLDHHLASGDSLLGTWLACLRRPPTSRRTTETLPLFDSAPFAHAIRGVLPMRFSLALEPNDTPEQVRAKEQALTALARRETALSKWKRVADLWCARWFAGRDGPPASAFSTLADAILAGRCALPEASVARYLRTVEQVAGSRRFFHWELEFPEVFFDAHGVGLPAPGFDAVIGNPPWDMVRADSGSSGARSTARNDAAPVVRFTRDSGVYAGQSDGHANRYQLFLERAVALTRPGGRIALVLPSGVVADHGSAALRRLLFARCAVDALVGFDNRRRIFPIHRSVRFVLLTGTNGQPTTEFGCRLGETDPAILDTAGSDAGGSREWFTVHLSPTLLETLSGAALNIPDLRTVRDLLIVERAATLFPPLGSPAGWNARFGRELNASEDRAYFRPRGLPVVEGKQIEPFRVQLRRARHFVTAGDAARLLGTRHQRARLGYRDVASATNRMTLIAGVLPSGSVSTHTVFCLTSPLRSRAQYFLCGLFNSFVVNYLARLRVTTHVTTSLVERLPIPTEDQAGSAFGEIAAAARVLSGRDDGALLARLNACVARLYGLTHEDLVHVLATFPLVPREDRDRARRAFEHM